MVIIQGVFSIDPGDRDAFLQDSIESMRISRAEKGCLEYVLAADPVDPGRVILSERWETEDDLNAHAKAGAQRRKAAAEAGHEPVAGPTSREITVYEVSGSRPLG